MDTEHLTFLEILLRFALSVAILTPLVLALGFVFGRVTGMPRGFPPFTFLPLLVGCVTGPLYSTIGYVLFWLTIDDQSVLNTVFVAAGVVLLVLSWGLPLRLSYTKSPRFAGATVPAQLTLGLLHAVVVGVSMAALLWR